MLIDINNDLKDKLPQSSQNIPIIDVVNEDTISVAIRLYNEGFENVGVLNMASEHKPGGGVRSGKTAQEEAIFRRTNAFMAISAKMYEQKNTFLSLLIVSLGTHLKRQN